MALSEVLDFQDTDWLCQLHAAIHTIWKGGRFCDMTIVDIDGKEHPAHSIILAGSSSHLASLLENHGGTTPHVVKLEVPNKSIRLILEFLYTGSIILEGEGCLLDVWMVANHLKISSLADWCASHVAGKLPAEALFSTHGLATVPDHLERHSDTDDSEHKPDISELEIDSYGTEYFSNAAPSSESEQSIAVNGDVQSDEGSKEEDATESATLELKRTLPLTMSKHRIKKWAGRARFTKKTDSGLYECEYCDDKFESLSIFTAHLKAKHGKKVYPCENCGQVFSWAASLHKHWKVHKEWSPYPCKWCNEQFKTARDLKTHKETYHQDDVYSCPACGKVYSSVGKLNQHMEMHVNPRGHMCCVCASRFNTKAQLRQHEKVHSAIKPFNCDQCDKSFSTRRHLEEHKISHSDVKQFKCRYCHKELKYASGLRLHEKLHLFGPSVQCDVCGKKFNTAQQLKAHMPKHTGEKPFKCKLCGKAFTSATTRNRHEFRHTGLKPCTCPTCGKSFPDMRALRGHELIHADIRPHQCDHCEKTFHTVAGLRAHKLTHQPADRKLYLCAVCNRGFAKSETRGIHEVKVHGLQKRKKYTVPVMKTSATTSSANSDTTCEHKMGI